MNRGVVRSRAPNGGTGGASPSSQVGGVGRELGIGDMSGGGRGPAIAAGAGRGEDRSSMLKMRGVVLGGEGGGAVVGVSEGFRAEASEVVSEEASESWLRMNQGSRRGE